jgi:hypothetical protein
MAPLSKGNKPQANRHAARAIAGNSRPRGGFPAVSFTNFEFPACFRSPLCISDIIDSINEQGEALRLHFEAVVAAVELPIPRDVFGEPSLPRCR